MYTSSNPQGSQERETPSWACLHPISRRSSDTVRVFPQVSYSEGGSLVRIKFPFHGERPEYFGIRGCIHEFSVRSRSRMLDYIASVPKAGLCLPLFITLTYPGQWSPDGRKWKRDLDVFAHRFERKYGKHLIIWKLEPQQRCAPHYHLMVYLEHDIDMLWLSKSWFEVVGSGDLRHLAAGTQVQRAESADGVLGYAAKYLGKVVPAGWDNPGRYWGVLNRKLAPVLMINKLLFYDDAYRIRRALFRRVDQAAKEAARKFRLGLKGGKRRRPVHVGERMAHKGARAYLKSDQASRLIALARDVGPSDVPVPF